MGPATIALNHGVIEAIAPMANPSALTTAQSDHLALPPLVNAHDHGRSLAPFTYGAFDQALELWLPALKLQPTLSVYTATALALAGMARSGVGAAVHCHVGAGGDLLAESVQVAQAARDVGIRLALAVPMRDRHSLVYGDAERLLALLSPEDRQQVRAVWEASPPSAQAQVDRVHAIAAACELAEPDALSGDLINVQYCPWGPQWCSHELLEAIATASATTGRRIHTHFLETRYQREWADAHYPQGLVQYLDEIGFLSPRLTIAHGVWLRPAEMELLAERGVIVSINTSSNLRLRSGIAPYQAMRDAGMAIAFGLDGMAINNKDDAFEELRLNYHLHCQPGMDGNLTPSEVLATQTHGFTAVTNRSGGVIEPGQAADILVVNYGAMIQDVVPDIGSLELMLLMRGAVDYVESLWIAGRQVVDRGKVLGVDVPTLQAEVQAAVRSQAHKVYSLQPLVQRYQQALRQFYGHGMHQQ